MDVVLSRRAANYLKRLEKTRQDSIKAAALRTELKTIIDSIPERNLHMLKPLLSVLSVEPVIIETSLTTEERKIIAAGEKEYAKHPENFVSFESLK
ncbi:MAG: hypothetical protein LBK13_12425 [Spirochaetales bacterium]|jgi:16S rRNA C1402 (ribose-2'-O) methylase RsmI|nr:hypothetical protein [Spirochaetales bacterium]